jgi:hypothetical protein
VVSRLDYLQIGASYLTEGYAHGYYLASALGFVGRRCLRGCEPNLSTGYVRPSQLAEGPQLPVSRLVGLAGELRLMLEYWHRLRLFGAV